MSANGHDAEDGNTSNTIAKELLIYFAFVVWFKPRKTRGTSLLLMLVSGIRKGLLPFARWIDLEM